MLSSDDEKITGLSMSLVIFFFKVIKVIKVIKVFKVLKVLLFNSIKL